ncbi:MAG: hypothetical protein JSW69_00025 [Deltaproteobacteria bacterium]|jgi:hypothetical protein|nr:MAG: hypothetical protein JSW69_00025 [Deltaproteobacteria bacterium]
MQLTNDIGNRPIKEVIEEHPKIGEILNKYEIGCLECSIGTCFVKDVVAVHVLGDEIEAMIEKEINEYLDGL